ncbi:Conserved oligomeric Golgi complex subunit 4 [Caenorhabditis elegans]|uniref:Isoform c of Conserved oligomeric Golgi complex subunit 4 n=1 Tax=Caenorhabditis elegans TaxID=6239 RepID=Q95XZ0-3|nr:Conserved oligomeric Golgi complex subunit 4 [Caenorhabditis elegans]CCD71792.1 Conserved oligomeric Golgi complex subunit 4 [Caenorhabditis elegans]|eukprot:NP_001033341.1 Conserved oligomeric Golgi complex subunit 4 [Caenorhabditis elegans]
MPEPILHSKFLSGLPAGRKNGVRHGEKPEKVGEKQFDFTRKIRELRLELEIKKREEERIEKDIAIILEENTIDGGEQNRSFGLAVTRLNNHMLVVENSAKQLTSALKNISVLADTISGRVSALDVAKTRVVGCLQLAGDMRDLGVCAEGIDDAIRSEDFETASQHIHRFLTLDQAVFQIREFKQKDATDSIRHSYEVLSSAKERLSKILKSRLTESVQKGDVAEMQRFIKMFPLIHEPDEGLQRYSVFLNQKIDKLAEDNLAIVSLLNVETIDEAMEVWHNSKAMTSSATIRTLTLPEVRKVLALRADFPTVAIKSIE